MNTRNALGFLSFGFVMLVLPLLAPDWFPPTGIDGSSARALWLEFMGGVQTLLGAVRMLSRFAVPAAIRWLSFNPFSQSRPAEIVPFETAASAADLEAVLEEAPSAEAA